MLTFLWNITRHRVSVGKQVGLKKYPACRTQTLSAPHKQVLLGLLILFIWYEVLTGFRNWWKQNSSCTCLFPLVFISNNRPSSWLLFEWISDRDLLGRAFSVLLPMKQYGFLRALKRCKTLDYHFINIYECLPQRCSILDIHYAGTHYLVYVRPEIE